jgi:tRNA(Ile)-lysidine synthase
MKTGLLERVTRTIARFSMFTPENRVIVAVSGGADSVCLLHVLCDIKANVAGVAHFNHKLRGVASDDDERFVAGLASRLNVPFYRAEGAIGDAPGNLEQAGRRARRAFFRGLIADGAGDRVALGHTRDDQAETVLFRMLRGSGLKGLAGIHPVTADKFARPLVGVTRAEILEYLRERGISWREDSTNADPRFARNRIRHQLLPQLAREWNPKIVDALANLADLAYEEERWLASLVPGDGLGSKELKSMPRALARRMVRSAIERAKGDLRGIEFEHIESVIDMDGARVGLPGVEAIRSCGRIAIRAAQASRSEPVEVTVPGTYPSPDGNSEIHLEPCVNLKVDLAGPLVLRAWRPGDHYRPVGKSRDQKIREMFRYAGVPQWQRRTWPVLESCGTVLWARQFGPAEDIPFNVSETLRPHQQ